MNMQASDENNTILQILPELNNGGVERGTIEIAQAIQNRGWNALVVSAGGALVNKLRHTRAEHIELGVQSKNPFVILGNARQLVHIIKKKNVSLVHARSRAPAWSAWIAAKWCGVPFVTTFHGVYGSKNWLKRCYNKVMTRGGVVIAVSDSMAEHVQKTYKFDHQKLTIIPRGVDMSLFSEEAVRAPKVIELTQEWRLPDDCGPVILMPARLTRGKGHHNLLDALKKMPHRNFMAVMLGDDGQNSPYYKELEAKITEYNLGGNVRFAGSTRDMAEAYHLASIVVCPTIQPEAFGRVPIEAMAMGCAVIASDHGGAQETIKHGDTGYLIPPGDVEQLAGAIEHCLTMDEETRKILIDNGRWWAGENFSLTQMQEKTIAVYENLLAGSSGVLESNMETERSQ